VLVVNTATRHAERHRLHAMDALRRAGCETIVAVTTHAGHATELARGHASDGDAVFALGGDGTAMEVISALADRAIPIGVLPAGTANILARTLGIPLDVRRAVHALLSGAAQRFDLGRLADGRHFSLGLGVGLDASMVAGASSILKRRVGASAYVLAALRAGLRHERFDARVVVDGQEHDVRASTVLVANFGSVANARFTFGTRILADDGALDVCVFSSRSRLEALRIAWRMLTGTTDRDPRLTYIRGRSIHIETTPPRAVQADGEILGTTPIDIEVAPGAATLLIPRVAR
jgi:diacylglycerol kinase (ATP)